MHCELITTIKLTNIFITSSDYYWCLYVQVCWQHLRSTLLANFNYSIINYSYHVKHYIPRTHSPYSWKLYPLRLSVHLLFKKHILLQKNLCTSYCAMTKYSWKGYLCYNVHEVGLHSHLSPSLSSIWKQRTLRNLGMEGS